MRTENYPLALERCRSLEILVRAPSVEGWRQKPGWSGYKREGGDTEIVSTDAHLKNREKGWIGTDFGTKAIFRFCSVSTVDPVILSISFNRHLCSQQTKNSPGQQALTQSRAPA